MKKITFYCMMLLSLAAFSQIEVTEDFNNIANNQVPAGWTNTGSLDVSSTLCGDGAVATSLRIGVSETASLTTPNYLAISNGTDLTVSFSYNVYEQVSGFPPPTFSAPATNWGSIVLEYTTDGGTNWTTITTIDDSNFVYVSQSDCGASTNINIGPIANGSDFQARFVATAVNVSGFALGVIIDNVSLTQVATTIPNCDAVLVSPAPASNTAEIGIPLIWQAATGLETGYKVSVGTTSGGTDIVNADTTTDTSYNLTGLTYETEYFVNIVPFNSFGDATAGCTEVSFTTRVTPIDGASCFSPIVVASFPYLTTDDTNNFEDNYDASPCNNTYMSGKDVFYEIAPSSDMSINIELTNVDDNGASIHVVEGCIDTATNCVAYVGTFSAAAVRKLENVVLLAGNTYYVVLSNSSNSRTYNYNLFIDQNSCINPEFTLAPVADCGNAQFSVDVDVTYLGDATDLTLSDDFGNTNSTISATGVVTFGPYATDSTVTFVLTNNQDNSCSYGDSTFFYCPPANDECVGSTALTINADATCTLITSAANAGATHSIADSCTGDGDLTRDVWFSFVATEENIILEYSNKVAIVGGATSMTTELLEGSCGSVTSLSCSTGDYIAFSGLTINNTYYIRNRSTFYAAQQSFDICLRTLPAPPTNDECSNAIVLGLSTDDQCDAPAAGTTAGATLSADNACDTSGYGDVWYVITPTETGVYEFSLERTGTTTTRYSIYEGSCGALTPKSGSCTTNANQIITLNSGQSYYVAVRTAQTGPGIDFNLCVYQLPPAVANNDCSTPTALLESTDLNGNNTIVGNMDNSYASPENCNSSSTREAIWYSLTPSNTGIYHFDFTRISGSASYTVFNTDDCSQTGTNYVTGITSCFNSGTTPKTGDLVGGNTYLIVVHATSAASFELFAYPDPSLSTESIEFESFKYYPNPVVNTLTVQAKNSISNISIYNIIGQEVQKVVPNSLETTLDMNNLNNGIYFVKVSINNAIKTFKVIKK